MMTPRDRLERYLAHLDCIFGMEPEFFPLEERDDGLPKIVVMVYRDVPEPGHITGVTYGLSEGSHPEWTHGRPELTISVESTDLAWPLSVGELAYQLRGRCPFTYGTVINFRAQISDESKMSAFFIFAPSILEPVSYLGIDLGHAHPVHIAGAYPIYDQERQIIADFGLQAFWSGQNFEPYSVNRPLVVPKKDAAGDGGPTRCPTCGST